MEEEKREEKLLSIHDIFHTLISSLIDQISEAVTRYKMTEIDLVSEII